MKLVKRWSGNLPMRLLVEIAEGHRISKQLIKLLGHLEAHRFFQLKIKRVSDCSELLKFMAALVNSRLCTRTISRRDILCHIYMSPFTGVRCWIRQFGTRKFAGAQ